MPGDHFARTVLILGPILTLFLVGFGMTLRSGVYSVASVDGLRKVAGNFTRTIVLLAGCVLGIAVLQYLGGFRLATAW
jgi:hypothetical protein